MNTYLSEIRVGFWPVTFIPIHLSWTWHQDFLAFIISTYKNNSNIRLNEVKLWVYWLDFPTPRLLFFGSDWLIFAVAKHNSSNRFVKTILIVIVPTERDCQRWGSKSIAPYQASRGLLLRSTGIPLIFSYLIVKG